MKTFLLYIIHYNWGVYASLLCFTELSLSREQRLLEQLVNEADSYILPILRMVSQIMWHHMSSL